MFSLGWILGLGVLAVIVLILFWPLPLRFTLQSNAFGNSWQMVTKMPFYHWYWYYENGELKINQSKFGKKKSLFFTKENLQEPPQKPVDNEIRKKGVNLWQRSFRRSLKIKTLKLKMGLKGTVSGEGVFIYGVFLAFIYPFFGYLSYKRPRFTPQILFDKESSGFRLDCIITFRLGQLIIEASKKILGFVEGE